MAIWMIWLIAGILCIIIEIFTPGFLFLSFGLAAIITGLFSLLIDNIIIQFIIFSITTFLIFFNLRKFSNKLVSQDYQDTNVNALKGKKGFVIKEITKTAKGLVRIEGEEWSAISKHGEGIEIGKQVIVKDIDGNKLIVEIDEEID